METLTGKVRAQLAESGPQHATNIQQDRAEGFAALVRCWRMGDRFAAGVLNGAWVYWPECRKILSEAGYSPH